MMSTMSQVGRVLTVMLMTLVMTMVMLMAFTVMRISHIMTGSNDDVDDDHDDGDNDES